MSWLFNGIPLHPLLVHATVVAVPVVALLALGAGWSNRLRAWLGLVLPVLASVTFVAALLTQQAGEALATQVPSTPAISAHIAIADIAVAGAFLLLVVTWWQWVWSRRRAVQRAADPGPAAAGSGRRDRMATTIAVVETAVAVFAIVGVVIAGDTGARAVWSGLL